MNDVEFQLIVDRQIKQLQNTLTLKGREYSYPANRLHNFETAAKFQHIPASQVCWNFMMKHLVSLNDMVASPAAYPMASWDEKIGDCIAYLVLLSAIAEEHVLSTV